MPAAMFIDAIRAAQALLPVFSDERRFFLVPVHFQDAVGLAGAARK
jgi:hypothetical protein